MALWIYAAFATLSTQDLAHIYGLTFYHAKDGGGTWTDSYEGDVRKADLLDSSDTQGIFRSEWGTILGDIMYSARTTVLQVKACVSFHELDRLPDGFVDAVSSAKMQLTLSGASVWKTEYEIRTSAFPDPLPTDQGPFDYWAEKEGGDPIGQYWTRSSSSTNTTGLQVGLFGLIERGGVVVADFLGGGGGIAGLDPTSEKAQVVDCPGLVSAYLKHRANYIGFMLCFIPEELSFNEIVGPFANAQEMLVAVHAASHKTTGMQFVGWTHPGPGYEVPIFAGKSTAMSVSWDGAALDKGVVSFDPEKLTMGTTGLLYDEVPGA
jgi:hypothetical protein